VSAADPSVRGLHAGEGPPTSPIAAALRSGTGAALQFLPAAPRDEAGWLGVLAAAAGAPRVHGAASDKAIVQRQIDLGAGPHAERNARRLVAGEAVAVVTGQQPGLYGGPLLTAHKIAGALHLARRLDALGGPPVVPVFWLASEDHDLEEANRLGVLDRTGTSRLLRAEAEPDGRSIAHVALAEGALAAVHAELLEALPDTPRARALLEVLAPRPGEGLAAHAARALVALFGDSGLVVLEPFDLLPAAGPVFAALVRDGPRIVAAVERTGVALRAAGLPAPVDPDPGALPLFWRETPDGPRLRVRLGEDGRVRLRGTATSLDLASLAEAVEADPTRASGDVVGRVFVQNAMLPVVAYIAGPSEIAYQAQVRAAAQDLGRAFPLALPRPEATWVDAKTVARLEAFDLTVGAALRRGPGDGPPPVTADEGAWDEALRTHLATLPEAVRRAASARGRGPEALRRAVERLQAAWVRASEGVRAGFAADRGQDGGRWARAAEVLWPRGKAQERFLSPWSLAARHGLEAVRAGLAALDPLAPVHHVVELP
jgi:bacillithiol biosynthesis cysteine-adding enzyme BshC